MENIKEQKPTKQRYLSGDTPRPGRCRISLDMEAVYRDRKSGMTIKAITEKYKVSRSTLDRRHKEYQNMIKESEEEMSKKNYTLPPIPASFT